MSEIREEERERGGPPAATAVMEPSTGVEESRTPLFSAEEAGSMRERWMAIQGAFVDEPHEAVHRADTLVTEAMTKLGEVFARERTELEAQWARGSDISTEDFRQAFRRYRAFFDRLLSV